MDIKGKIVLLTGAASGIGRATAEIFVQNGANLILPVRDLIDGEKLRKELQSQSPEARVAVLICDLASFKSIQNFISEVRARYDHIDILINNAGVFPQERQTSVDGHELNFAVNYLAPVLITRGLLDLLKKSTTSRVVNVSSTMCKQGQIDFADLECEKFNRYTAYAQSKLALVLFTRTLAQEINGEGIIVNALHPGIIKTDLALQPLKFTNAILRTIFMMRMESPSDGAKRIEYLVTSPDVAKISGEYFEKNKIVNLPDALINDGVARRLDEETQIILGLTS
jgi:NAD(P)-dependent dehydrogenase (short-subunit alcohol dehydrogenase family)